MNATAQARLQQLFITKDDTVLYFSKDHQEWRDIYGKHAHNADHEGYPVTSGLMRIAGAFQSEGYALFRAKFAAMEAARMLLDDDRQSDGSEELHEDKEALGTIANTWAADACEESDLDFDAVYNDIYDHLCHLFPDYA